VYIDRFCGLAFASDAATRHIIEAAQNEFVAGSIGLETAVVGRIRGIQLEGKLIDPSDDLLHEISAPYMMRFPVALLMKPRLWFIELLTVKMTDNRLGFGKKLYWNAHSVT
jgi:uncharacterized protein YhbP (UPF0306 family)